MSKAEVVASAPSSTVSWSHSVTALTDEVTAERADLKMACAAIGRDPATIEVLVGISIRDRQTLDANILQPVVGRADHIAVAFAAWSEEGVTEAMCRLEPASVGVVETRRRRAEIPVREEGQLERRDCLFLSWLRRSGGRCGCR